MPEKTAFVKRRLTLVLGGAIGVILGLLATDADCQTPDPRRNQSIQKGVSFLKSQDIVDASGGRASLAAYALLKAGEPPDSPEIQGVISRIRNKITTTGYTPEIKNEHIYEAGVDAMLLADADPEDNRNEIEAVVGYIISQQGPQGDWDYPQRKVGDTSISQYGLLGLWAAARVGIDVPDAVWDKAAGWHLKTQLDDGGFAYHPGLPEGPGRGDSTHNMTAGATANLGIIKLHLYPRSTSYGRRQYEKQRAAQKNQEGPKAKFGVLQTVDLDNPEGESGTSSGPYSPKTSLSALNQSIERGLNWLEVRFRPVSQAEHRMYFYYALERSAALNEIQRLGSIDWFTECAQAVMEMQEDDGSWKTFDTPVVGTSFALLFLTRSTGKLLGQGLEPIGGGLMVGGRGLPDDPSQILLQDGKAKARKDLGPLDELLATLERTENLKVRSVQKEIVEKVQLGDREELIGQVNRLLKLATHPDVEVRRTALWALGRSGDLKAISALLKGLQDPNVDVMVEAHNALCFLARKPFAFGLSPTPLKNVPEDASEEQRQRAIDEWRQQATAQWTAWYRKVRPYRERDMLAEEAPAQE